MSIKLIRADNLSYLKTLPTDFAALTVTSPSYEDKRRNALNLKGEDWVAWALPRFLECLRVTKGLVAWVVEGRTRNFDYSATPMLLAADLHRAMRCRHCEWTNIFVDRVVPLPRSGKCPMCYPSVYLDRVCYLRKPFIYKRHGVPGATDYARDIWEFIICGTKTRGRLPYSDPTACGGPQKYTRGGNFSNRDQNGKRVAGRAYPQKERTIAPNWIEDDELGPEFDDLRVLDIGAAGGGHLGDKEAHEHTAPFSEKVPERFIKTFTREGDTVLDPFVGSGTTTVVADALGRNALGIDIDPECIEGCRRRHKNRSIRAVAAELEEQEAAYHDQVTKLLNTARKRLGVTGRGRELAEGDQTLLDAKGGDQVAEELSAEFPGILRGEEPYQSLYELLVNPPARKSKEDLEREAAVFVSEADVPF